MTKDEVTAVLERLATRPEDRQQELAEVALEITAELAGVEYEATPDELAAIDEGLTGEAASEEEVPAAFALFCGVSEASDRQRSCGHRVSRHTRWTFGLSGRRAPIITVRRSHNAGRIISCSNRHCLLLTKEVGDPVAIKSGFSSRYGGEGPRRSSYALQFLSTHGAEIEECEVDSALIERLDQSALTTSDLEQINAARPIRPSRWDDYVMETHYTNACDGTLWQEFRPVIPFAVIDGRIIDLALSFWEDPDDRLPKGYRRLEDIVRERTGVYGHGAKLFSKVLSGPSARLQWKDLDEGEKVGRVNLFTGTYMAHRNPRAHRELKNKSAEQLAEFLLLNHLFRLEQETQSG